MASDNHPLPGKTAWYGSIDGGENYEIGPCVSAEDVRQEARDCGTEDLDKDGCWYVPLTISKCTEGNVDLAKYFDHDRFLAQAAERMDDNGEGSNEDGDQHPIEEIDLEQAADLENMVRAAIRQWQKKHSLPLRSWYFSEVSDTVYEKMYL